jgi:hypothetical protein
VSGVRVRLALDVSASLEVRPRLVYRRDGKAKTIALSSQGFRAGRAHDLRLALPRKLDKLLPFGTKVEVLMKITATLTGDHACQSPQVDQTSLHTRVATLDLPRH